MQFPGKGEASKLRIHLGRCVAPVENNRLFPPFTIQFCSTTLLSPASIFIYLPSVFLFNFRSSPRRSRPRARTFLPQRRRKCARVCQVLGGRLFALLRAVRVASRCDRIVSSLGASIETRRVIANSSIRHLFFPVSRGQRLAASSSIYTFCLFRHPSHLCFLFLPVAIFVHIASGFSLSSYAALSPVPLSFAFRVSQGFKARTCNLLVPKLVPCAAS